MSPTDSEGTAMSDTTRRTGEKLAYSVTEAAELLSLGRTVVFRLIKTGELGSMKVGNRRLVAHEDLEIFVANRRGQAA